jgi:hypothetical protein
LIFSCNSNNIKAPTDRLGPAFYIKKTVGGKTLKYVSILILLLLSLATVHVTWATANTDAGNPSQIFATPETTWTNFKKAILNSDFDTARNCCCEEKVSGVRKYEKMNLEKRKEIFSSMQELQKVQQHNNTAKYKLTRNINGSKLFSYVYFKKINNEWKIENY